MLKEQDFTALTTALRGVKPTLAKGDNYQAYKGQRTGWENAVYAVAGVAAASNRRFNLQRFLDECGVNQSALPVAA